MIPNCDNCGSVTGVSDVRQHDNISFTLILYCRNCRKRLKVTFNWATSQIQEELYRRLDEPILQPHQNPQSNEELKRINEPKRAAYTKRLAEEHRRVTGHDLFETELGGSKKVFGKRREDQKDTNN